MPTTPTEGFLLIAQEQLDQIKAIEQALFDDRPMTPDRRRDLANKLWLITTTIRAQNA